MNCFMVDDEALARAYLRKLIEGQSETVVGEAADAAGALQQIEALRPDVVFLDIQMPGLTGMQMAAALHSLDTPPLVIFVTGYSEHAVRAFEQNALDYLLKPVAPDRLAATLLRARERLADREARCAVKVTPPVQSSLAAQNDDTELQPLTRLPVREAYAVRFIPVEEILYAAARDKQVIISTGAADSRTYYTLRQLESLLPAARFLRVHDSCIVNLEHIAELHSLGSHSYLVQLSNGVQLPVSRLRYPALQRRLGLAALPSN